MHPPAPQEHVETLHKTQTMPSSAPFVHPNWGHVFNTWKSWRAVLVEGSGGVSSRPLCPGRSLGRENKPKCRFGTNSLGLLPWGWTLEGGQVGAAEHPWGLGKCPTLLGACGSTFPSRQTHRTVAPWALIMDKKKSPLNLVIRKSSPNIFIGKQVTRCLSGHGEELSADFKSLKLWSCQQ